MRRRDFFRLSGGSALLAGAAILPKSVDARNFPSARISRTDLNDAPRKVARAVADAFGAAVTRMQSQGWSEILRHLADFDLDDVSAGDEKSLFYELAFDRSGPLKEFGGRRAIQPGDPAMSLLYHVLAASEATFQDLPATAYPRPEEIDAVENYIYDCLPLTKTDDLVPAVFAYEYRQAYKTPHLAHADLVFARAGVSRTGTQDCVYDAVQREYRAPGGANAHPQDCATVAARFGLFLAKRTNHRSTDRIAANARDGDFGFLVPVCKLVSGGRLLGGRGVQFQESHRDEKLLRLMREVGDPGAGFALDRPPFLRKSMSEDGPEGSRTFPEHTTPLVSIRSLPGSARIFPEARPLVRAATQRGRLARFRVPAKTDGTFSNRRYTSLKLVQDRRAEAIDAFFSDFLFRGGRPTTGLRAARNAPSFVYIRAAATGENDITYLSGSQQHLDTIAEGEYDAALFEDGLCDGCVTARITGQVLGEYSNEAVPLPDQVLPAISFVAAPDFFPRVDPLDIERFDAMFLEGGTESASGLRLPGNPLVDMPGQPGTSAFPIIGRAPIAETMTAAVSLPANVGSGYRANGYARSSALNTLTDTVSNVFFPGWDITYSNAPGISDHRFMASFGLGSPFPEDMKLCAAANGMWAGASPDASRTFYGTLERLPLLGRPATAVPLLDSELGYHPSSSARSEWHFEPEREYGWDGEHGPFLVLEPAGEGIHRAAVDCSDIVLADYVRNALENRMDLGRMQDLHNRDIIDRMAMLKTCVRALPRGGRAATTDMWLVSAEHVANWGMGAEALGVPGILAPRSRGRIAAAQGIAGSGFLYPFAYCPAPGHGRPSLSGRRRFTTKRLYLCQGDARTVRYARLYPADAESSPLRWSRAHVLQYS